MQRTLSVLQTNNDNSIPSSAAQNPTSYIIISCSLHVAYIQRRTNGLCVTARCQSITHSYWIHQRVVVVGSEWSENMSIWRCWHPQPQLTRILVRVKCTELFVKLKYVNAQFTTLRPNQQLNKCAMIINTVRLSHAQKYMNSVLLAFSQNTTIGIYNHIIAAFPWVSSSSNSYRCINKWMWIKSPVWMIN